MATVHAAEGHGNEWKFLKIFFSPAVLGKLGACCGVLGACCALTMFRK